jgi:hypothetical protein
MTMSAHFETSRALESSASWYGPGAEIGEDTVPAGEYAVGIDLPDGGAFWVGTAEEIDAFVGRIQNRVDLIKKDAARPLTFSDFEPDEDGNYPCPRCKDETFEPAGYVTLAEFTRGVQQHITEQHGKAAPA